MDKAGQKYWNDSWGKAEITESVNPSNFRLNNYINRRLHHVFLSLFDVSRAPKMRLLELGCAKSSWLPYFVEEFGLIVSGIDYSPIGCEMAQKILELNGVEAEVICANFFEPPKNMLGSYDVVVSFGVVEHFEDTAACLRAASGFLKPGGILFTSIPNMLGLNGNIQKIINKPVYEIHQLINKSELIKSHELAGLDIIECDYFICNSFGVLNLTGVPKNNVLWFLKKILIALLARLSISIWMIERVVGYFPSSRLLSPYINCIARKP